MTRPCRLLTIGTKTSFFLVSELYSLSLGVASSGGEGGDQGGWVRLGAEEDMAVAVVLRQRL